MTPEKRYENLLLMDRTHDNDRNRKAMFYLIANSEDLYRLVDSIYDFSSSELKEDAESIEELSTSSRSLLKLALNLISEYPVDVSDVFCNLDSKNFEVAYKSLQLKYL